MNNLAKKLVTGFGVVVCALNFGGFAEPRKVENSAPYHVLLSGDLYQLCQNEESSKVLSSYGISLNDTRNSVGVIMPLKDNYLVKIVDRERVKKFNVGPATGKKIIRICESDLNDVENKADISLYGRVAQEIFKYIPERVKNKLKISPGNIGFASLSLDDSPRLWYAPLPKEKKASDLYQINLVAETNNWKMKRLTEKTEPPPDLLKHIDLTDGEHTDLLLKFIEGKKYDLRKSDFFISEGESVIVHDSLASIISFNKKFIEAVYSFLPSKTKENLPGTLEAESIFISPSKNGISLRITAKDSYLIDLKGQAGNVLINFLSKYGYTNPLKFET